MMEPRDLRTAPQAPSQAQQLILQQLVLIEKMLEVQVRVLAGGDVETALREAGVELRHPAPVGPDGEVSGAGQADG